MDIQSAVERSADGAPPLQVEIHPTSSSEARIDPARATLVIWLAPLVLREGEQRRTFCFEITGRVRLWSPAQDRWLIDEYIVWTNPLARHPASKYVRPLSARSTIHPAPRRCADAGTPTIRRRQGGPGWPGWRLAAERKMRGRFMALRPDLRGD
jgi:hypothetical protein